MSITVDFKLSVIFDDINLLNAALAQCNASDSEAATVLKNVTQECIKDAFTTTPIAEGITVVVDTYEAPQKLFQFTFNKAVISEVTNDTEYLVTSVLVRAESKEAALAKVINMSDEAIKPVWENETIVTCTEVLTEASFDTCTLSKRRMFLWSLAPIEHSLMERYNRTNEPSLRQVVAHAYTEDKARELASKAVRDEFSTIWLNPELTTCNRHSNLTDEETILYATVTGNMQDKTSNIIMNKTTH